MELIKYIILGIIQGITEPLPISSSGHIFIFKQLFDTNIFNDLNFEIFVNFASFIAIFIIFYKDIITLIKGFFLHIFGKNKKKYANEFKYCMLIVLGTIPVGITGILLKDIIETTLNRTWIVGITFIITGICLLIVKNINGNKDDYKITYKDALIIGLFQAIALLPGLSRSGMVLVGCLLCKLNRTSSLKYTFMLYLPVSVATFILGIKDVIEVGFNSSLLLNYSLGMIFSFIFTLLTYKVLTEIVRKGKLWKFSIYLFIIGILTLIIFI
ncbi:MAG: undecaprenyl-diphosphate phosphatase [Bacilli bacterium]|nr:undecaprenyl-diphosphate phosphatase [Bacilli bacterium]